MTEQRDASALLAGCHEPWRRQRPERELLTRVDWHRLLPLVAQLQAQRPDVTLPAVLTDRVASRPLPARRARLAALTAAAGLPAIGHRPQSLTPRTDRPRDEDTTDYQHLSAVRALGGPAAVRAALAAASERPNERTGPQKTPTRMARTFPRRHFPH